VNGLKLLIGIAISFLINEPAPRQRGEAHYLDPAYCGIFCPSANCTWLSSKSEAYPVSKSSTAAQLSGKVCGFYIRNSDPKHGLDSLLNLNFICLDALRSRVPVQPRVSHNSFPISGRRITSYTFISPESRQPRQFLVNNTLYFSRS